MVDSLEGECLCESLRAIVHRINVQVVDHVVEWLDDPEVTDIVANMLSSDMMKHTGSYQAAKKGNEVTDVNLGRIKEKIDEIRSTFLVEVEGFLGESALDDFIIVLRTSDFNDFITQLSAEKPDLAERIKELSKKVPLLVVTADHGASKIPW